MSDNHLYDHACLCEICQETRRNKDHALKMSRTKKHRGFQVRYNRVTQESHRLTVETEESW